MNIPNLPFNPISQLKLTLAHAAFLSGINGLGKAITTLTADMSQSNVGNVRRVLISMLARLDEVEQAAQASDVVTSAQAAEAATKKLAAEVQSLQLANAVQDKPRLN